MGVLMKELWLKSLRPSMAVKSISNQPLSKLGLSVPKALILPADPVMAAKRSSCQNTQEDLKSSSNWARRIAGGHFAAASLDPAPEAEVSNLFARKIMFAAELLFRKTDGMSFCRIV